MDDRYVVARSVDALSVDDQSVDSISVHDMSVDSIYVDYLNVENLSVDDKSVDKSIHSKYYTTKGKNQGIIAQRVRPFFSALDSSSSRKRFFSC